MVVPEKQKNSAEIYSGHIIKVYRDEVLLGEKEAVREVVRHKGATAILAVDENKNAFFVEQFRYPINSSVFEAPAGKSTRAKFLLIAQSANFWKNAVFPPKNGAILARCIPPPVSAMKSSTFSLQKIFRNPNQTRTRTNF